MKIQNLDYRFVLVDAYKSLGLNEMDLAVLLVCDNILKEQPMLITPDVLALKMTYDLKTLDEVLVNLLNKGYLSYDSKGKTIITSIQPTLEKVASYVVKQFVKESKITVDENKEKAIENIYSKFENSLGRTLAPLEFEKIKEWIDQGVSEELILLSLEECKAKSSRITLRAIDKLIIKKLSEQEIAKEGYSSVTSTWKTPIDKTIDMLGKENDK
ncbi:MAG: DnaD domain protein [Bacilli bacterium]